MDDNKNKKKKNPFENFINKELHGVDNLPAGGGPVPEKRDEEVKPEKKDEEATYDKYLRMIADKSGRDTTDDPAFKKLMLEIIAEAKGMILRGLPLPDHQIRYIHGLLVLAVDEQETKTPAEKMGKAFLLGMIFQRRIFFEGLSGEDAPKSGGDPTAKTK